MNVHALPNGLRAAVQVLEARYPITIIGILPRGSAVHVPEGSAIDLLAKKRPGLSLLAVAQAEADFAKELGRPVGIVLTSEVRGEEAARLTAAARPLWMEERSVLQRDARGFARKAHELIGGMPLSILKSVEYYEHAARSYLIIVGEALNRLPPDTKDANPQIPWDAIRGMRNRLVHGYWRVDLDIVKRAVAEDLPELVSKLDRLIEDTK